MRALTLLLLLLMPRALPGAQQAPTDSPARLADAILEAFEGGDMVEFAALYPFEDGRDLVAWAVRQEFPLKTGLARVLRVTAGRAVVLLSGHAVFGNTGAETAAARAFSGLYEMRREGGTWRLTRQLPLGDQARIQRQALDVRLTPGRGLDVVDTLTVQVTGDAGLTARLNHSVRLGGVEVDGAPAEPASGGGIIWVPAPPGEHTITLRYALDVPGDSGVDRNSGWFGPRFGHVRNQFFWHPFYDFQSEAQQASFSITVRAPATHRVATDLPQAESVAAGERIVHAVAREPTFALSLFYDADWTPVEREVEGYRLEIFGLSDFAPSADSLVEAFRRAYGVLAARFGPATGGYLAVVQSRAREGRGWLFRSNDAIATPGGGGGPVSRGPPWPRAWLGHELAHGWTRPTGPAANFLREGWATYAEALLIDAEYGPEAAAAFWEIQRSGYFVQGHEGRRTLLNDPSNSGIAYNKGAWVLRMLEDEVGADAFRRGISAYMAIAPGAQAGIGEFVEAMSEAAARDVRPFLRSWLEETTVPDVEASVEQGRLVLRQHGPVFRLSPQLDILTGRNTVRTTVRLSDPVQQVPIGDPGRVSSVLIDPDQRLLLHRRRGENVTFRTRAPDASAAELSGTFTSAAIPARRDGEDWVVTVPLTAGRYAFWWTVDGRFTRLQGRTVSAREELPGDSAYPHPD